MPRTTFVTELRQSDLWRYDGGLRAFEGWESKDQMHQHGSICHHHGWIVTRLRLPWWGKNLGMAYHTMRYSGETVHLCQRRMFHDCSSALFSCIADGGQ